ncbi:MAG: iron complex transport system permease protein, partial [Woeseiaceae bacterium]
MTLLNKMNRTHIIFIGLILISFSAIIIGLISGSADISLVEFVSAFSQNNSSSVRALIMDLRLPRVFSAFAVGGLLSVSGVLMQVLLRNPLAEPYILGSSGGAAVAALMGMSYGL